MRAGWCARTSGPASRRSIAAGRTGTVVAAAVSAVVAEPRGDTPQAAAAAEDRTVRPAPVSSQKRRRRPLMVTSTIGTPEALQASCCGSASR